MSNYHVFECDRCLKEVEHAEKLPEYWATIKVLDTNRSSMNNGQEYERNYCQRCMGLIREAMKVVPASADKIKVVS